MAKWIFSLRLHLAGMVIVTLLPAMAILLYDGARHREAEILHGRELVLSAASRLAARQELIYARTRQAMDLLSLLPEVQEGDAELCNIKFRVVHGYNPDWTGIYAARKDGSVFAGSAAYPEGLNLAGRSYFRRALRSGGLVVGEYAVDRVLGIPSVAYARPVYGPSGETAAVLVIGFNLQYYRQIKAPEPSGLFSWSVLDARGARLYRYPESAKPDMEMGQKVPPEILARVLGTEAEGTYEAVGSDGVPRLYGFRQLRLEGESAPYTVVIVGFDKRELLAKAAWGRNLNIMFLFFAAMLAIALASKISQISVLRPVRLLIETAQRIGAADLGARTAIPHVSGEMGQLASAIDDMATSLQQKARDLQENEARYKQLVENANDMIFRFDLNGRISFVNPVTRRISGYSEGEILGHSYADFLAPEDRVSLEAFYREQFLTGTEETYQELPFVTRDGRMIWLGSNVQLIRGEDGRVSGFQAISRDITERKRMEEELEKAAITDALTGLYNRRGFLSLAQRQMRLAERSRKGMILCFIDLDGMKDINDRLGHEQGDAALTETAAVLTEVFRESDILARIGGDEFAVLAIDSSADHEDILRNRLYERVARHNGMAGRLYILSMSCGMAFFDPEAPVTMDDLMAAADIRMYEQKRRKKGAAGKKESPHAGA